TRGVRRRSDDAESVRGRTAHGYRLREAAVLGRRGHAGTHRPDQQQRSNLSVHFSSSHHAQTSSPSKTRAVWVLLASVEAVACVHVTWPDASGRQAITREYPGVSAGASVTVTGEGAGSVETITNNCGEGGSASRQRFRGSSPSHGSG